MIKKITSWLLALTVLLSTVFVNAQYVCAEDTGVKANQIIAYDENGNAITDKLVYVDADSSVRVKICWSNTEEKEAPVAGLTKSYTSDSDTEKYVAGTMTEEEEVSEDGIRSAWFTFSAKSKDNTPGQIGINFIPTGADVQLTLTYVISVPATTITINDGKADTSGFSVVSGHQVNLSAKYEPKNSDDKVKWSLWKDYECTEKETAIAEINEDTGVLRGLTNGECFLRAKAYSPYGLGRTVEKVIPVVVVKNNPAVKVQFKEEDGTYFTQKRLKAGTSYQMSYEATTQVEKDSPATDEWKWSSSDTNVATIDSKGYVECKNAGTTTIKLQGDTEDVFAVCALTVYTPAESVSLAAQHSVKVGKSITITATEAPLTATEGVTWTYDKEGYIELSDGTENVSNMQSVTVKGIKEGSVLLTATTDTGRTAKTTINVTKQIPAASGSLLCGGESCANETIRVYTGKTVTINGELIGKNTDGTDTTADENVVWRVSGNDEKYVDETHTINGGVGTITLTGVKPSKGSVKIELLSDNGDDVYASCMVDVLVTASKAEFVEGSSGSLATGCTMQLTPKLSNSAFENVDDEIVSWTSTNENVATVDKNGVVCGVKTGSAQITAITQTGCKATYNVAVVSISSIRFGEVAGTADYTIKKTAGTATSIRNELKVYTTASSNAITNMAGVNWDSSDKNVAVVDANGTLTALLPGETMITAQIGNDTATMKVIVTLSMNAQSLTVSTNENVTYQQGVTPETGLKVMFGEYELKAGTLEPAASGDTVVYTDNATGTKYKVSNGADYAYTCEIKESAGTYTIRLFGEGTYVTDSRNVNFVINAKDINDADITVSGLGDQNYTGTAVTVPIVLKDQGIELKAGTDYNVTYTNNTKVSTGETLAKLTITGKSNYKGTLEFTYKIVACPMSGLEVVIPTNNLVYSGNAVTPNPTVKNGSRNLTKDTDYTVTYSNNVSAGTASMVIAAKDGSGYTGSKTVTYTIAPYDIAKVNVSLESGQTPYKGSAYTPKVTAKMGNKELVNGVDYTVAYTNNVNAGKASVVLTGKGNYSGKIEKNFNITTVNISTLKFSKISNRVYTGKAIKPSVSVKNGSNTLVSGKDYTISYKNNKKVGTVNVTVTGIGNYTGTYNTTFKIVPKKASLPSVKSKKKGTLDVKVKKATGATAYEVQYSTSSKFKKSATKTATINNGTKVTLFGLKSKKYYVRVRAYASADAKGAWSKTKKIKVK